MGQIQWYVNVLLRDAIYIKPAKSNQVVIQAVFEITNH